MVNIPGKDSRGGRRHQEPVDRVHFLGSYSTGKMGFALARKPGPRGRCDADQYSTNLLAPVGVKRLK